MIVVLSAADAQIRLASGAMACPQCGALWSDGDALEPAPSADQAPAP